MDRPPRTAAATEAHRRFAAERAIEDKAKLEKALRIARLALERGKITIADLGLSSAGVAGK